MTRSVTGVCLAAALGLTATLAAQSTTTTSRPAVNDNDREVTISGCLSKGANGYTLTNARIEPNASANTTTTGATTTTTPPSATSTTTAGAAGTSGMAAAAAPTMTWMLSNNSDLERHVGHKIQVTGRTSYDPARDRNRASTTTASGVGTTAAPPSATTSTTGTTTTAGAGDQPRLDVKSIKMVSTSCP